MKNLGLFFREVRVELGKVIWPGKDEFFGAFVVVLITMVLFTLFFAMSYDPKRNSYVKHTILVKSKPR